MEVIINSFCKNRLFPSCFEPHYKNEAKCKAFHKKMSFFILMKTNFHDKNYAWAFFHNEVQSNSEMANLP